MFANHLPYFFLLVFLTFHVHVFLFFSSGLFVFQHLTQIISWPDIYPKYLIHLEDSNSSLLYFLPSSNSFSPLLFSFRRYWQCSEGTEVRCSLSIEDISKIERLCYLLTFSHRYLPWCTFFPIHRIFDFVWIFYFGISKLHWYKVFIWTRREAYSV